MTLGELIDAAMMDETGRHSNGKFYTLEQVKAMELRFYNAEGQRYRHVLSVYPTGDEKTMCIDID
jgi:hypothetical protein